jgi:galactose mutarotase-like enzyme
MSASITLTHTASGSSLELVPDAGMVALSWTVAGDEVLALPCGRAEFLAAARTGGLPLLYPYANRLGSDQFEVCGRQVDLAHVPSLKRDDARHPIHGLVLRRRGWSLSVLGPGELQAELDWGAHAELMDAFPFPHTLRVRWTISAGAGLGSASLSVRTEVLADRGVDVPAAFGWHPYFRVQDPDTARIRMAPAARVALGSSGLPSEGAVERARSDAGADTALPAELAVGQGQDALYLRSAPGSNPSRSPAASPMPSASPSPAGSLLPVASVVDALRRIDILMDGHYPFMQVFSPRGVSFACVEPMTAPTDGLRSGDFVVVAAGSAFAATFEIHVIPCLPASVAGSPTSPS